jgi:F0F1-type ATP synthase membrane subunit b/b'
MDPIVAVIVSFSIFIIIAYRLGYRRSMKALDDKIATIQQTLEEAAKAREAALQAVTQERRRYADIGKEIDLTINRAEEQALSLRHQAFQELDDLVKKRHREAEQMINRLHEEAVRTLQEEATAATLTAFETLVEEKFTAAQHEALNENSLAKIAEQLEPKGRRPIAAKRSRSKSRLAE